MKKVNVNEFGNSKEERNPNQLEDQSHNEILSNHELTPEKIRTFKGLELVNEVEAASIIYSIKELSIVLYQYYCTHKQSS